MNVPGVPAGSLQGVRVLDLTRVLAGPFCTRLMADMGAHVVKVEPPGGDAARQFEYITPEGVSGYFMQQNCGKEDICLDLANLGAREVMRRLVRVSDVVVENFRPGVMKRLGLDYESLRRLNPSIILCSISAFGQNSPYANRPAGDMVVQAMTGIASLTGDPDGPPQTVGMSLSDTSGGVHAFGAICAALYHRSVTGRGQFIDLALADCILWQNEWASQYLFLSGGRRVPERYGNRRPILIPGNLFRGKGRLGGYRCIHGPGLAKPHESDGIAPPGEGQPICGQGIPHGPTGMSWRSIVEEWVASFESVQEVEELLGDRGGVQCGRVRSWKEMLEDPHVEGRRLVASVDDPLMGPTSVMNSPFRIEGVGIRGAGTGATSGSAHIRSPGGATGLLRRGDSGDDKRQCRSRRSGGDDGAGAAVGGGLAGWL